MKTKWALVCAPVLLASAAHGEMRVVQLVFLKSTGRAVQQGAEALQQEHIKYLESLWVSGRALAVGPLADGGSLRGLVILKAESRAQALGWMEADPMVRVGMLRPVILPWYTDTASFHRAPRFLDLQPMTFTLLIRPASAPSVPQADLAGIGEGHMANIRRMAEGGLLAAAGPFDRCGAFRGVFVFRGTDRQKMDDECQQDPAIRRGLLVMRHYTWYTAQGTFNGR